MLRSEQASDLTVRLEADDVALQLADRLQNNDAELARHLSPEALTEWRQDVALYGADLVSRAKRSAKDDKIARPHEGHIRAASSSIRLGEQHSAPKQFLQGVGFMFAGGGVGQALSMIGSSTVTTTTALGVAASILVGGLLVSMGFIRRRR